MSQPSIQRIDVDALAALLHGGVALIVGHGATYPGLLAQVAKEKFSSDGDLSLQDAVSAAMEGDAALTDDSVCGVLREAFDASRPDAATRALARFPWSAAMSFAMDAALETAWRAEMQKRPVPRDITVVSDLELPTPPRTTPVFKMMGEVARNTAAVSDASYRQRKAHWHKAVESFYDLVRSSPVFVVGMAESMAPLLDVMAQFHGLRKAALAPLVFLDNDPILNNKAFFRHLPKGCPVVAVGGKLSDLVSRALRERKVGGGSFLPFEKGIDDLVRLEEFDALAALVNARLTPRIERSERNRLQNLLFSPAVLEWDPFAYDMDFRRSASTKLVIDLQAKLRTKAFKSVAVLVRGTAASGKTTLIKRLAFEVAKAGSLVFWVRPFYFPDAQGILATLFRRLTGKVYRDRGPVVFILDDPASLGSLSPRDLVRAAELESIKILLLVGVRSSEWETAESPSEFTGGLDVDLEEVVPDSLDNSEWKRLPKFLTSLGVAPSEAEAQAIVAGAQSRSAQDTLSALYWLLPEVRSLLGDSIRDEYIRLGDRDAVSRVFSQGAKQGSRLLQDAYRMIAVAESVRAPVPIEVLVSALGTDYSDWRDASTRAEAGWGLFYSSEDSESQSICYRTRNAIVTKLMTELVNGGQLSHTAEVAELERMLRACTGTLPAYREFCLRVLVRNRRVRTYEYEEGVRLFDAAIGALPWKDATLLHHKAIWQKDKGRPVEASAALDQALAAGPYPYGDRQEAAEHIHTTYAATLLSAMKSGKIAPDVARSDITRHLEKARSEMFFNPQAVHVQANLTVSLCGEEAGHGSVDQCVLVSRALADVERTIRYLDPAEGPSGLSDIEDEKAMLVDIRGKLVAVASQGLDPVDLAEKLWVEKRSQDGVVLLVRRLHEVARMTGFGSDFNEAASTAAQWKHRIEGDSGRVSPELCAAWADVYFAWRVGGRRRSSANSVVDWQLVVDLARQARNAVSGRDNCNYLYFQGVGLWHLKRWAEANAVFREARAAKLPKWVLWSHRDCMIENSGEPMKLQGTITTGGDRTYLKIESLGTDVLADRTCDWPRTGEVAHAYVVFSLGGPIAVIDLPFSLTR